MTDLAQFQAFVPLSQPATLHPHLTHLLTTLGCDRAALEPWLHAALADEPAPPLAPLTQPLPVLDRPLEPYLHTWQPNSVAGLTDPHLELGLRFDRDGFTSLDAPFARAYHATLNAPLRQVFDHILDALPPSVAVFLTDEASESQAWTSCFTTHVRNRWWFDVALIPTALQPHFHTPPHTHLTLRTQPHHLWLLRRPSWASVEGFDGRS